MASSLRGTPDPVIGFQKSLTEVFGENYPRKAIVDKWRGVDVPLAALDKVVSEAIAVLRSMNIWCRSMPLHKSAFDRLAQPADPCESFRKIVEQ
jgi:hypothetical protein